MGLLTSRGVGQYAASAPTDVHVAITDRLYQPRGKNPVVWCHSSGGTADEPVTPSNNCRPMLTELAQLQVPILSYDAGGTSHWGNDAAQARTDDAIAYLRTKYGAGSGNTGKVVLVGVSMGSLLALNWAKNNPSQVAALVLFYPVTDLAAMHDATGGAAGGAAAAIEAAYGGAGGYASALPTHSPILVDPSVYRAMPIVFQYSTADATVGTPNQEAFLSRFRGPNLYPVQLGAVNHADMTKIRTADAMKALTQLVSAP